MRKQYTDAKREIQRLLSIWEPALGLTPWYDPRHKFVDVERAEDAECAAATSAKYEYRTYVIEWYLPNLAVMTPEHLEGTVVHELVHVLLCPLDEPLTGPKWVKVSELATETVARALVNVKSKLVL